MKLKDRTLVQFWTFTLTPRWFYKVLLSEFPEIIFYNSPGLPCSVSLLIFVNVKNNDFLHYYLFWVRLRYLPRPRLWLMNAHLFPILSCKSNRIFSYWIVQLSLQRAGSRWLLYLNGKMITVLYIVFRFVVQSQTSLEAIWLHLLILKLS